MCFQDFYTAAGKWLQVATEENRRKYALDIIQRFLDSTQGMAHEEFNQQENQWFSEALQHLTAEDVFLCSIPFNLLCDSTSEDAVRAIEFSGEITNMLVAIDNWLHYRRTQNQEYLLGLAISITDTLDYHLNGDWESEVMLTEIEHQRQMLSGEFPLHSPRYNWASCQ